MTVLCGDTFITASLWCEIQRRLNRNSSLKENTSRFGFPFNPKFHPTPAVSCQLCSMRSGTLAQLSSINTTLPHRLGAKQCRQCHLQILEQYSLGPSLKPLWQPRVFGTGQSFGNKRRSLPSIEASSNKCKSTQHTARGKSRGTQPQSAHSKISGHLVIHPLAKRRHIKHTKAGQRQEDNGQTGSPCHVCVRCGV